MGTAEGTGPSEWEEDVRRKGMTLPTLAGIEAACERIRRFQPETPLIRSAALSSLLDADVWLKLETATRVASFKLRGALNHLLRAREQGDARMAVTSSTGNHGQGVACAAGLLELESVIFLPRGGVAVKRRMIELFGGKVIEEGRDIDEAKEHARRFAAREGAVFVDDGESLDVMEGAGTTGLEIARRLPSIDRVYLPMGSGVLATGAGSAVRALQPSAKVIAVQSTGSPAMAESYRTRRPVEREISTLAESIMCRVPAVRALLGILDRIDACRLVGDELLLQAMHTLLVWGHVLAEIGASAGLAGAWQDRHEIAGQRIVVLVTGANLGTDTIMQALRVPPFGGSPT